MSVVSKIVQGVKGSKSLFRKMEQGEEKTAMYQHLLPYQLKDSVKFGVVSAVAGYELLNSVGDSRKLAQLGGEIQSGNARLSGMTDTVQLSNGIQKLQKGKNVEQDMSLSEDGVSGDIVFAMHNMR